MLKYFNAEDLIQQFWFLHSAKSDHLVLYNTEQIHKNLMLPWVKCALKEECISPIGSQSVGCQVDLKPKYLYTGCHGYDMAALNVILGMMFDFIYSAYEVPKEIVIFSPDSPLSMNTTVTKFPVKLVTKRT